MNPKQTIPQASAKSDIKRLFRVVGQLHRAGYHTKTYRYPGNVVTLTERAV